MVDPFFDGWIFACVRWLFSHRHLATYFLEEATLVLGDEDELPTSAPPSRRAHARELLEAIAIHAGREHVVHEIVPFAVADADLVPAADGEPIPVPLPTRLLGDRWSTIAMLARGVIAPIVLDVADGAPGGAEARGMVLDVAGVLAGFGPPVLRAADVGTVVGWSLQPREGGSRLRDLDGTEVAHVHAVFEALHGLDAAETDRVLSGTARSRMHEARTWSATRGDAVERLRAEASGALASYRDRGPRVR